MGRPFTPQNCPFHGDLNRHLIHGSLGPPESSTQTEPRSLQPFLQGSLQYLKYERWPTRGVVAANTVLHMRCERATLHSVTLVYLSYGCVLFAASFLVLLLFITVIIYMVVGR